MPRGKKASPACIKNDQTVAEKPALDLKVTETPTEVQAAPTQVQEPKTAEPAKPAPAAVSIDPPQDLGSPCLSAFQVERTLRLAQEIQMAAKDLELCDEKATCWSYEERLLVKDHQLIDKQLEIIQLKKQLSTYARKEFVNRRDIRQRDYQNHTKDLSRELKIDFSKCAFDPTTGAIDVITS